MKRFLFAFICIALVLSSASTFAATKQDVISAIKKTYTVGDSSFRLPDKIINKAVKYLNSHPLSEEKYDGIMNSINNAVAIAEKNGTTDITKIDKKDIREGLSLMVEAAETANVDLNEKLSDETISAIANSGKSSDESTSDAKSSNEGSSTGNADSNSEKTSSSDNLENNTGENSSDSQKDDKSNEQAIDNLINSFTNTKNNSSKKSNNIDKIVKRNLTFIAVGLVLIIFVLIFIFYLIFKSKWYKIIKYILMIILVVLILIALVALIIMLINLEEIRLIYKLYYLIN